MAASLAMHLSVGFPNPWPAVSRKSVAGFYFQLPSGSVSEAAGGRMNVVIEMRDLLPEYGVTKTRKLQQDWRIRQVVIEHELTCLKKFHDDPRVSY